MIEFLLIASLHFAAVITPGQDFVWVVQQTLAGGRRAGIFTSIGVALGILFYSLLAILGMQAIFERFEILLVLLKLLGAGYLFYIGYSMFISNGKVNITEKKESVIPTPLSYIKAGLQVNLSNVKAILFFAVLFTSVISHTTPKSILFLYGIWMSFATFAWFSFVAIVFGNKQIRNKLLSYGYWIDKISGLIFISFSLIIIFNVLLKIFYP